MKQPKNSAKETEVNELDTTLAECESKLVEAQQQLEQSEKVMRGHGDEEGAEAQPTAAIDPATLVLLITTVINLIKAWRDRK